MNLAETIMVVMCDMTYNELITNANYIPVFHKSIYYVNKFDHTLFNTNQVCHYVIPFWYNY